jgi:hypothetical protein
MTINKLFIAINADSEQYAAQSDFDFEVAFITEYFSRIIKKSNFKYKDANKLIIRIDSSNDNIKYEPIFKTLTCNMSFSYLELKPLAGHTRTEKILDCLALASNKYEIFIPGIVKVIQASLMTFRNNGYKNIWLFKKKRISEIGQAELFCELDRQAFTLTLLISNKDRVIYRKEILKTKPSPIIYQHKFKDILVSGDLITIIDRFDEPLYQVLISNIMQLKQLKGSASQ